MPDQPSSPPEHQFGKAIPIFRVSDLARSIDYYVSKLGFKVEWQFSDFFASVSRDRCNIFLCVGDQGHFGTWTWIGVPDSQALFEQFKEKGAKIRHPPTNYSWALEIQVEDPDGNILRMGSDSIKGEPSGEWLDMDGKVWPAQ